MAKNAWPGRLLLAPALSQSEGCSRTLTAILAQSQKRLISIFGWDSAAFSSRKNSCYMPRYSMFNSSENILAKPPQRCWFVLFKMENEKKKITWWSAHLVWTNFLHRFTWSVSEPQRELGEERRKEGDPTKQQGCFHHLRLHWLCFASHTLELFLSQPVPPSLFLSVLPPSPLRDQHLAFSIWGRLL